MGRWVRFPNATLAYCACGPSRGNLFTGQHWWHTGIRHNEASYVAFDEDIGVYQAVRATGAKTAICGKFINGYPDTIEDNLAAGTITVGYRYKDPALSANDDLDYFYAAQTTAAAGLFRKVTNTPPVRLLGEAEIVITVGGAEFPITNQLVLVLDYDFTGHG